MTTAAPVSLRSIARSLPLEERTRRQKIAEQSTTHALLVAVVNVGIGGGEWRSSSECARDAFAIEPRTMRDWLSSPEIFLPRAIRRKLLDLAWAFGVEVPA